MSDYALSQRMTEQVNHDNEASCIIKEEGNTMAKNINVGDIVMVDAHMGGRMARVIGRVEWDGVDLVIVEMDEKFFQTFGYRIDYYNAEAVKNVIFPVLGPDILGRYNDRDWTDWMTERKNAEMDANYDEISGLPG